MTEIASEKEETLLEVGIGREGVVVAIRGEERRVERLAAIGIVLGCSVVVRQRKPVVVIDLGETSVALEPEIAAAISVVLEHAVA